MNSKLIQIGYNADADRQENDLYCTNPKMVELLLQYEKFSPNIWEPCNGLSHISDTLRDNGYNVRKSDILSYNQDDVEIMDFLETNETFDGDIVTNPPYKNVEKYIYKALESANKVAMLLKVNILATQKRKKLFDAYPPKTVYVLSKRYMCAKNGEFEKYGNGAVDYVWIIWEKDFKGDSVIKWI